jgi:hypothetical protein
LGSVYQITFVQKRSITTTNIDTKKKDSSNSNDDMNDDNNDLESDIDDTSDNNNIIEQKRIISNRKYDTLYQNVRDHNRHIVLQRRILFLYNRQSFNIHIYQQLINNLCILHAQVEAETMPTTTQPDDNIVNNNESSTISNHNMNNNNNIDLPPFLEIDRILQIGNQEDDEKYGAYSLSIIRNQ